MRHTFLSLRFSSAVLLLAGFAVANSASGDNTDIPSEPFSLIISEPDLSAVRKLNSRDPIVVPQSRKLDPVQVRDAVGAIDADTEGRMSRFATDTGIDTNALQSTLQVPASPAPESAVTPGTTPKK